MKAEEVLEMSITKMFSIRKSELNGYLLQVETNGSVLNHLSTAHASILFSLAEISSGYFLARNFEEVAQFTIPILRSSTVKYKVAASGMIYSKARLKGINKTEIISALKLKSKTSFVIDVKLYNKENKVVLQSEFEWFVTIKK